MSSETKLKTMAEDVSNRRGDWIQTYNGVHFWPLDPRPEDINIEDIARALSHLCRFTGHVSQFYSVAEHSVRAMYVARNQSAPFSAQLAVLLHDASEAYISDISRPLKRTPEMKPYRDAEAAIQHCIHQKFGVNCGEPNREWVRSADETMLVTEARDLMGVNVAEEWSLPLSLVTPLDAVIDPWSPYQARKSFLRNFARLVERGIA